jgi:hydroxymethylglutaryl-CoA lyase
VLLFSLKGCPYAAGASGNVATEDVLYMLKSVGIETNVDISKIISASNFIMSKLDQNTRSRVGAALSAKK